MDRFSKKEYLRLKMPTEEVAISDHRRIELALHTIGYENVTVPLGVLRKLYPLCRDAEFDITVTLVHREFDWVVTDVEAGDTTAQHYALAVDYGSTTMIMQLVDMNSGAVIAEEKRLTDKLFMEPIFLPGSPICWNTAATGQIYKKQPQTPSANFWTD